MSISSTTNRVLYSGDGSSTVFPFSFYFFNPSDLLVYLFDTNSSVVYAQTLNTNYTISGNISAQGVYPGGGNVVMASSFPSNLQLVITRSPPQIQNYNLLQNGPINSLALTQQLDYLTTLVQRLQDEVNASVRLPDGLGTINNTAFTPTLPQGINLPAMGGSYLTLNSGATGWQFQFLPGQGSIIVPVSLGGTGQGGPLTQNALIYAANSSAMGTVGPGAPGQVLQTDPTGAPFWTNFNAGSSLTGIISTVQGGTGNNISGSTTIGSLLYFQGSSSFAPLAPGTSGQVLTSQGGGFMSPVWTEVNLNSSVVGTLGPLNGGLGNALVPSNGSILYYSGTGFLSLSSGTPGFFLTSGSSAAPSWSAGLSNPMNTLGDIIYGSSAGAANKIPGNTTTTKQFLSQTGTGAASAAPLWTAVNSSDLTLPNPTPTVLGGVKSIAASSHSWVNSISTAGVPTQSQPTFSDIAGTINSSQVLAPQQIILSSGANQIYTLPTSPAPLYAIWILSGAGGGGGPSGTGGGGSAAAGANSIFGSSNLITCGGGGAGAIGGVGGGGGTITLASGVVSATIDQLIGGGGTAGSLEPTTTTLTAGGIGGQNPRGGAGFGVFAGNTGQNGAPTSGAGGGGASISAIAGQNGSGGGSGAWAKGIMTTPPLTIPYTIGDGGAGGTLGTGGSPGGKGGTGVLILELHWQ